MSDAGGYPVGTEFPPRAAFEACRQAMLRAFAALAEGALADAAGEIESTAQAMHGLLALGAPR